MEVRDTHAASVSGNFGVVPLDGERDWRAHQDAEVVAIVGIIPNLLSGENQIMTEGLLKSGVEFIAPAGAEGRRTERVTTKQGIQHNRAASRAGEHQIFVERSFHYTCVGDTQNRVARFDVVCNTDARLGFPVGAQTVIEIAAQAKVERPVSFADRILQVQGELLYIGMPMKREDSTFSREVEGSQRCARSRNGVAFRIPTRVTVRIAEPG